MKTLILGAGKHIPQEEDKTLLDIRPFDNIDVVHDLNLAPWPFYDNTFTHVNALHVVEHLNSLVNFMDECWRILAPGGSLYIETPHADPANFDLMFCDPTHKMWLRKHSFINYFSPEGVAKFGYTNLAWALWVVDVKDGVLIVHCSPIKVNA